MNSVKTMMAMVAISLLTGCAVVAGKVAESDAFLSAVGADKKFHVGTDYFSKNMMPMPAKDDPGYPAALQKLEVLNAIGENFCGKYDMDMEKIWSRDARPGYEARYRQWRRELSNDAVLGAYGQRIATKARESLQSAHAGYLHTGVDCNYYSKGRMGLGIRDAYFLELWIGVNGKAWLRAPTMGIQEMVVDLQKPSTKKLKERSLD